jgi:hypothetical protein
VSFLENAESILRTAEVAQQAGQPVSDLTILYGPHGGIDVIANSDWPLDRLAAERGAKALYRVSQHGDTIRVDGLAGFRTCRLETEKAGSVARRLLGGPVLHSIA